jgi:hypothetical protein
MNNQQQNFREKIRLVHDLTELRGTCYFEILPGRYQGKCWNQNSVFMTEEVFGYLEPIFERRSPDFNHYSFVEITKNDWIIILADFSSLLSILSRAKNIREFESEIEYRYSVDSFASDFHSNTFDLMILIRDFSDWVVENLNSQEYISVLGI